MARLPINPGFGRGGSAIRNIAGAVLEELAAQADPRQTIDDAWWSVTHPIDRIQGEGRAANGVMAWPGARNPFSKALDDIGQVKDIGRDKYVDYMMGLEMREKGLGEPLSKVEQFTLNKARNVELRAQRREEKNFDRETYAELEKIQRNMRKAQQKAAKKLQQKQKMRDWNNAGTARNIVPHPEHDSRMSKEELKAELDGYDRRFIDRQGHNTGAFPKEGGTASSWETHQRFMNDVFEQRALRRAERQDRAKPRTIGAGGPGAAPGPAPKYVEKPRKPKKERSFEEFAEVARAAKREGVRHIDIGAGGPGHIRMTIVHKPKTTTKPKGKPAEAKKPVARTTIGAGGPGILQIATRRRGGV